VQFVVQRIARQGSSLTPTARIAATTPRLIVRILNSVFLKTFNNVKLFSNKDTDWSPKRRKNKKIK